MTIRSEAAAPAGFPANSVENALFAAVRDRTRVGELLDELCHGQLWLPLPDGRPVTDGHALTLPTVRYLDAEFIPAFTSAGQLNEVVGQAAPDMAYGSPARQSASVVRGADVPHAVVPAVRLARLLPAGLGIALNPGAPVSVPIYPDDVAFLASTHAVIGGSKIRVGPPPEQPTRLLSAVAAGLRTVRAAKSATRAWLTTEEGHGLVICVTLDDPQDGSAQEAAAQAVQHAVDVTEPGFAIDITFPGQYEPGPLEQWTEASAGPFYLRG
ncbi:MAG TPA: SseB family protein [Streptosporangiaceae bacterium]|nr:SseB family protein [Streptosporangiaceae bacterium]